MSSSAFFAKRHREKLADQLTLVAADALSTADAEGRPGRNVVTGQVVSLSEASQPDGTWVLGRLLADDGATQIPFVGSELPGCEVGCVVRLVGRWERHPEYGPQFRATDVESELPTTREGVIRYLGAHVKGCGPARAGKLVDHFGPRAVLAALAADPSRVLAVFGGKTGESIEAAVATWAATYGEAKGIHDLKARLMHCPDVTFKLARRIITHFKRVGVTEDVVLRHPYRLIEVPGIGFKKADTIARGMGVDEADPSRMSAGVVYALEVAMEKGDSALPRAMLLGEAQAALTVEPSRPVSLELVQAAIDRALAAGTLVDDDGLLFLPRVLRTERELATRLMAFIHASRSLTPAERVLVEPIVDAVDGDGNGLSASQKRAVWMALENGISILTGRPGSGKTTTTRTFTKCCEALKWSVQLGAPTGKAAARAAEVTGLPAKTVHRLIGGVPGEVREEPIDARVIILDEVSMADLDLVHWLVRNVDPGKSSLLFVGDQDQLPSVGHGAVLADMLASREIPSVGLVEIFRQAQGSRIITNAHRLLDGKPLLLDNEEGTDFLFADVTSEGLIGPDGFPVQGAKEKSERSRSEKEAARQRLVKALRFLTRKKQASPVRDIQVLTPMRVGELGVDALNALLQDTLNPDGVQGPDIGGRAKVRIGDRVIQTKNDYTVQGGLFNGEQGEVVAVGPGTVTAQFDGRRLTLTGPQLFNLRLAWAITVHRSQGSEFPYTLLLYHTSHWVMLDRALLYTAITRAKRMFILIGTEMAVTATLRQAKREGGRHTGLAKRLTAAANDVSGEPDPPGPGGAPELFGRRDSV